VKNNCILLKTGKRENGYTTEGNNDIQYTIEEAKKKHKTKTTTTR